MFKGFREEYAQVDKGKLFYRIGGEGTPLLLLHGYPQTHVMWYKTAPELAKNFTIIAADLRDTAQVWFCQVIPIILLILKEKWLMI